MVMKSAVAVTAVAAALVVLAGCSGEDRPAVVSTAPVPPSATAQTASSVPPGEGAPPRCNPVNVWDASTSGTGIAVALMYQPAPGPITVTVREKSGKTDNQSRTLAPGEDSPQFDFPAVSKDSVESVFVQTSPASRCVVSAFGSG